MIKIQTHFFNSFLANLIINKKENSFLYKNK